LVAQKLGKLAFLIGIVLCVLLGLAVWFTPAIIQGTAGLITLVLIILGIVVGFLNINEKHNSEFLIAVIAVVLIGSITIQQIVALIPVIATIVTAIFQNIVALVAPAALIVGLKQIFSFGMSKKV
jgi:hypothetical protein